MKTFEHTVLSHRGALTDYMLEMITMMGADGWAIISAYAVQEGASMISTHYFVLRRDIEPEPPEPRTGPEFSEAMKPAEQKGKRR